MEMLNVNQVNGRRVALSKKRQHRARTRARVLRGLNCAFYSLGFVLSVICIKALVGTELNFVANPGVASFCMSMMPLLGSGLTFYKVVKVLDLI